MSDHEAKAREILDPHLTDTPDGYVIDFYEAVSAIAAALREEREECAKIADVFALRTGESIAAAIRSRGAPTD
jgi:hypothetical protein